MVQSPEGVWIVQSRLNKLLLEKMVERGEIIRQTEIARATGLDNNTVSRWMSTEPFQNINTKVAVALCKFLDCELGDLLVIERGDQNDSDPSSNKGIEPVHSHQP